MTRAGFAIAAMLVACAHADDAPTLDETIDVYDPITGAYVATEQTEYALDGRRLRQTIYDADGNRSLLFLIEHEPGGREAGAWFVESDDGTMYRETFSYSDDGRMQTITYFYEPGVPADRTEVDLDAQGRETAKRFFRADGSQYGEEDVLWNTDGSAAGWEFRYLSGKPGARFDYRYLGLSENWKRRLRLRDGKPERQEARRQATTETPRPMIVPGVLAPGAISTGGNETSPSFTADGKTMVFARYTTDWTKKTAHMATLDDTGWTVTALAELGTVYNLTISGDGRFIVFARRDGDRETLFRVERRGDGWSEPLDLSQAFGLNGSYAHITAAGDLVVYDADGDSGDGLYASGLFAAGYAQPKPRYVPGEGHNFDGWFSDDGKTLLVTRCLDSTCESNGRNGIWRVRGDDARPLDARLPYAWGAQPVPALGILVMTDGDDILTVPLAPYVDALAAE